MRARDGKLLQKLAVYLNFHADAVTEADVRALAGEFSLTNAQTFALLLAGALGLDAAENEEDARIVREDFPRMLHPLDAAACANDPYTQAVHKASARMGTFELGYASYRPYELFVADDLRAYPDGAVLPVLG
ncbi:MAG: hypothetical protein Q4B19_09940, partial [Clostridia bacterium]|nr:hypothetical protein [Clostridia bacterium]